jgi:hypothetical protein
MIVAGRTAARKNKNTHPVFLAIDRVATLFPTLARRFFYVGRQVRVSPLVPSSGSLPYQLLPS